MSRTRRADQAREQLWAELPRALRRRSARTRAEKCIVLDLIETARNAGLSLAAAARTCGVSAETIELWRGERQRVLAVVDQLESAMGSLLESSPSE